jgi:hypothetical protein
MYLETILSCTEEEERQLLEKEPGEEDDEVPLPGILDVSMEDAPPANSTPNPNPNEGGSGANAAMNPPNPNEGGSGATVAVEIPNPTEGGRGSVSNINTGSVHPNEGNPVIMLYQVWQVINLTFICRLKRE